MTDISFYKYLEAAFRHKLFKDRRAASFNYLGYNLPYETMGAKKGIFEYARRVLPSFYSLHFPDTEEGHLQMARDFLQKLDRRLDPELPKYFDPAQAPAEYGQIIAQAQQQSQAEGGGAPAQGIGAGMPGLPTGPSTTSTRLSSTTFQLPKIPSQFAGAGKTLASDASIGLKKGLTKVASGFSGILGGVARGGGSLLGGIAGGGGRALGGFGLRAIDATTAISQRASTGSLIKGPSKKFAIWAILGFIFLAVTLTIFSLPTPPPDGGSTTPTPLDYKISFRDSAVSVDPSRAEDIKNLIRLSWPNAKLENWDIIVQRSINAGWNPAFVLALWIEESGAQGAAGYSDPLGCTPNQPTDDIEISLSCLFNNFSQYSNDQFQQFMESYSGGPAGNPFANNPNFVFNLKSWYATLIPEGTYGAIEPIITTPPPGVAASCPIPDGVIKTPSYQASPTAGHCSPSYGSCPPESRKAKAIDVDTKGENVLFPTIDGQEVDWYYLNQFSLNKPTDCEGGRSDCGIGAIFQARAGSTMWTLHLLHLDPWTTLFNTAAPNRSATAAGKTVFGVYVHINIGKDIQNAQNPPQGDRDFDLGWLPADFMCP